MILNMPFPQILKKMTVHRAIRARGQHMEALLIADGASPRPIQMMMGPVTIGGRKRMTFFSPTSRMTRASTTYIRPATTIPPHA